MIASRIIGGLGNQLFQYGFGFAASRATGHSFAYETASFSKDGLRSCRLPLLRLEATQLTDQESLVTDKTDEGHTTALRGFQPVSESMAHPGFAPESVLDNSYLIGYWQKHTHVQTIRKSLQVQFQPIEVLADSNLRLIDRIDAQPSLAIHVRRGDYVSVSKNRKIHGPLGVDYYGNAVLYILERNEGVKAFVFSDEPEWAQSNLRLSCTAEFIGHNGPELDYEELTAMSRCGHFVIANSTFSWWAAFLSEASNKIVIAPDPWFADRRKNAEGLIPSDWIRLSAKRPKSLTEELRSLWSKG